MKNLLCSLTEIAHSYSSPALNSSACTKVLYFTDHSLTPFMINIAKRSVRLFVTHIFGLSGSLVLNLYNVVYFRYVLWNFPLSYVGRLGEVTLRDFKDAVDREGNYRYHFKALDPEFGTVKEEVMPHNQQDIFSRYSSI